MSDKVRVNIAPFCSLISVCSGMRFNWHDKTAATNSVIRVIAAPLPRRIHKAIPRPPDIDRAGYRIGQGLVIGQRNAAIAPGHVFALLK